MPPFAKPTVNWDYTLAEELKHLNAHKKSRGIPARKKNRLLVASWNIANFGVQKRRDKDIELLARIISWFDVMSIQEVNENYKDLLRVMEALPASYDYTMSDAGGNDERLAFVFRKPKVKLRELVGEIAVPPAAHRHIKLKGVTQKFKGFDRNPYLAGFQWKKYGFVAVGVHLYYGSKSKANVGRRALEAYAVARWADLRKDRTPGVSNEVMVMGDFNMPAAKKGDSIYEALTRRGLVVPAHATKIATTISTANEYDQVAVFPGSTKKKLTGKSGVFDFDGALFPDLWETKRQSFDAYMRYYVSDHRLIWYEFK